MNVLFTKKFFAQDIAYIKERVDQRVQFINESNFVMDELPACAENADVFFGGLINEEMIRSSKNLKYIQIPWTGVDNINWDIIRATNVVVCNSHSNSTVVAEHAVAMMMDATKKISFHDRQMRQGNWNRLFPGVTNEISPFSGTIKHSKVGILGFGAIGQSIQELLTGFSCTIHAFNRTGRAAIVADKLHVHAMTAFKEVAKDLDFLFISLPLTADTKGMINAELLHGIPNHCILINVSRGEVMVESDLFEALQNNQIAWAAMDTWYNYPNKENPIAFPSKHHPFEELNNITMSPHRAGYVNTGFPHLDDGIENLNRAVAGKPLINIISSQKGY